MSAFSEPILPDPFPAESLAPDTPDPGIQAPDAIMPISEKIAVALGEPEKLVKTRATGLPRLPLTRHLAEREEQAQAQVKRKRRHKLGKPKLAKKQRREFLSCRVMPHTREMLNRLGCKNPGWAIDALVRIAEDSGLFKIPTQLI